MHHPSRLHLFFPSVFHHFASSTTFGGPPVGRAPDGLIDVRFVVSRNGVNLSYADVDRPRSPFVPLGINRCGLGTSAPSTFGGWCSPANGEYSRTSFDTSMQWMAKGYVESNDGSELLMYAGSAAPPTL